MSELQVQRAAARLLPARIPGNTLPRISVNQAGVAGVTPLAAALLDLLTTAQAAVSNDREAASTCLARATALLLADLESVGLRETAPRGALPRWQSKRLLAYIEENLSGPISSADLIPFTGLSAGHFFRSFKATFGETPCAFISRRRIEHAKTLMLTTTAPLSRIALDCGLCDQSHLTRMFRRFAGTTPKAWRRENVPPSGDQNR